jgi:uncharacterized protein YxjI
MHPILARNAFFVKEHVGMFKAANNFDVLDPDTQAELMHCREPKLGFITQLARFTDWKRMTPFDVHITTPDGKPILRVQRGFTLFLSKVKVYDENDQLIGMFKQKLFSIGGTFSVLDDQEKEVCMLKGKWTSWDFRFMDGEKELAHVSKKWGGMAKEMFTTADNYVLTIAPDVPGNQPARQLILAAVMCIDMVLKE